MIIKFGSDENDSYRYWNDDPRVFISRPFFKIIFGNGFGFYILNSFKFYFLPRFYYKFENTYWEFGFRFAGYIFEVMWNKYFKK
jgi:hypothetical protein